MRIYKPTRRTADGKKTPYTRFYCEFRTADGRIMRLPGYTHQRLTEALGRHVQRLMDCRASGEPLPQDTAKWIKTLPQKSIKSLARRGLLQGHTLAAGHLLSEHIADWKATMLARGLTAKHVGMMCRDALRIFAAGQVKFMADIRPGNVQAAIAAENAAGLSLQTCNHMIKAVKAFTHWACRDGRLQIDPLAHLTKYNVALDRRHDRRALSDTEVNALMAAAEAGPTILGLDGHSRAMLYRIAVGTGFRRSEIKSLTPENFNLDGLPPTITVKAAFSKHRREDVQPIRRDLADLLRTFVAGKPAGTPIFNMPKKTYTMMQADLASARAQYLATAVTEAERTARQQSDFCLYVDATNRYADFHSLRHTYITRLVKSHASVKVCQELARHSDPKLTFTIYSHVDLADTSRALDNLPGLDNPQAEKPTAMALRTGTDNLSVEAVPLPGPTVADRMARHVALLCIRPKNSTESGGVSATPGHSEETPPSMQESSDNQGNNETALAGTRNRSRAKIRQKSKK